MFCTSTWTWILYCDALSFSANHRFFCPPLVQLVGELETKQFAKINAPFVNRFLLCGANKIFCNFLKCSRSTYRLVDDSKNVILSSIQVKIAVLQAAGGVPGKEIIWLNAKNRGHWLNEKLLLSSLANILLWHYIICPLICTHTNHVELHVLDTVWSQLRRWLWYKRMVVVKS